MKKSTLVIIGIAVILLAINFISNTPNYGKTIIMSLIVTCASLALPIPIRKRVAAIIGYTIVSTLFVAYQALSAGIHWFIIYFITAINFAFSSGLVIIRQMFYKITGLKRSRLC